ncbi:hypothetical protein NUU61_006888 [Penicillium alfredii]|uniref:Zn(2)-C6 fungal-type domain-containing protein n=1 Tax=Penicillium alfredii TaxID=1506179 RepID=A0A9W9F1M9_9EURO|nr:uncharacterized protein NUU61_006888 [Penicillium alfredii]KAJ5092018.1 hypothetical protein NUU61_006888 [Penicillium alfredii]
MPSRRSHTKSRKGCSECKRRHVKCDEGAPKCSLCKKRKLECVYPPPNSDADSPRGSSIAQDGSDSGALTPGGDSPWQTRMVEMRLFHQYLTATYHTLAQDGLSGYHLSISIPRMATSFPYLLDSLLALSALHLATAEPENRRLMVDAALRYQSQACSGLGKVLSDISPPDYEPAFVSSIFIMLFATGLPVVSLENRPVDPLSAVLEVRTLITGCAMLFNRINEMGTDGELDSWLCVPETEERLTEKKAQEYDPLQANDFIDPDIESFSSDDSLEDISKLFDLHRSIMQSLEQLRSTVDTPTSPNQGLYQTTWKLLWQAIEPWPKIGSHGGVISWPLFITDEYLNLLQNGDWMARVLFLHYGVAMRLLCNRWYVRDWGRRLVMATLEPLGEIPPEWSATISWMKQAVEIRS